MGDPRDGCTDADVASSSSAGPVDVPTVTARCSGRRNRRAAAAAAVCVATAASLSSSSVVPTAEGIRLSGRLPAAADPRRSVAVRRALEARGGSTSAPEEDNEEARKKKEKAGRQNKDSGNGKRKKKRRPQHQSKKRSEEENEEAVTAAAREQPEAASGKQEKKKPPSGEELHQPSGPRRRRPPTSFSSKESAAADPASGPSAADAATDGGEKNPRLPPAVESILRETDYYSVLGVTKSSTSVQITKAYRRRAVLCHPDKLPCGDRRAFDLVAEAYGVLSDDKKRDLYDRYGKEGVEAGRPMGGGTGMFGGGMGGGGLQEELFRQFFGGDVGGPGGGGGGRGQAFRPRNRTVRYQLEVTLEELYNGLSKTVTISQPGDQQQHFDGRGRQSPKRKTVEVSVAPGMAAGQTVTLHGESDHVANATPADVVFVLAQRRHPSFTRRGHDLAMEVTVSLREALCGFEREVIHLDGRRFRIGSPRMRMTDKAQRRPRSKGAVDVGSRKETSDVEHQEEEEEDPPVIIRTGDVHVLKGEGMPKLRSHGGGRTDRYGDLYVQYTVEMPGLSSGSPATSSSVLTADERDALGELLDKLEGRTGATSSKTGKQKRGDPAAMDREAEGEAEGERKGRDDDDDAVRYLQPSSAQDFGRASGPFDHGGDDHHGDEHLRSDDDNFGGHRQQHPFGPGRSFFQSFGGNSGRSGFHYFSSSGMGGGFGGKPYEQQGQRQQQGEEGSNVECQQM